MANLTQLLHLIDTNPAYQRLVDELKRGESGHRLPVLDAAKPFVLAALYRHLQVPLLIATAQVENAKKLCEQLAAWTNSSQVKLFPEPENVPVEAVALDTSAGIEKMQVLSSLADVGKSGAPPIVVVSAVAFMQKAMPYSSFIAASHTIRQGMNIEPLQLLDRWQAAGYEMREQVELPGTMSHRGGIIDIYPPASDFPARLEFFGDTIDSIRLFDFANQRSLKTVDSITIAPAGEGTAGKEQGSILDYLPSEALLILDEPQSIKNAIADFEEKAGEMQAGEIAKSYFSWNELGKKVEARQGLSLTSWSTDEEQSPLGFTPAPTYAGQLPLFVKKIKEMLDKGNTLIVVSHQSNRLSELLEEEDIFAPPVTEIRQLPAAGALTVVQGSLDEGWIFNEDTYLLTDAEIFGFVKQRRLMKKRPIARYKTFNDIVPGEYVVHVEHGIARFAGVVTMGTAELEKEYLVLEYAGSDKLYVPTDQIDRVSRYIGGGETTPVLSRLGTQEWNHTKQKVKESAAKVAKELLALYASREVAPGYAFSPDTVWQRELEGSFPYVETPDQLAVQKQVKEDMEKPKPMDRLVCGDVGYGKTEVAIRAAFKTVMDGKQVAVLVPTTVLAQQHLNTFRERLAAFPLKVEMLSRFRSPKEQKDTIEGLANGSVDICIGTHRLIQKDVIFKDLGLLIIDEEQRFGVYHKEYLKKMRKEVDVLTLSATPIPRTLHMSLVGVRDMSVMETPPEERLPVKTYVSEYSDRLVREAILRELEREGQVFFVHNRVQSIAYVAHKLEELVPEARFTIAHGQMQEGELEQVISDFIQGKSDVLVCTSIIQSGIDMPNVNTLIVNQSDRFGLTQLYQLRGRVGRGSNLAYAYFLYDKGKRLTPVAEKRLKTIFEATELGAGFSIAMKDLEIRGAGTLLGVHQSGHITAVGFNLYCQLMAQAVEEEKAKLAGKPVEEIKAAHLPQPTIDLPFHAFIPEDYIEDLNTRLALYQKLVKLEKQDEIDLMAQEFSDRFGGVPPEVENLLYAVRIKLMAMKKGIESITTEHGEIIINLFEGLRFDKEKLEPFFRGQRLLADSVHLDAFQLRLDPKRLGRDWRIVLEEVVNKIT